MTTTKGGGALSYRSTGKMGVSLYEVSLDGEPIGRVQRYQMGAAQFGASWMAHTIAGRKQSGFRSRDAAAAWLVQQVPTP